MGPSDRPAPGEVVRFSLATAGRQLRIARRQRQVHGFLPWLLALMSVALGWLLQRWWVVPVGLAVEAVAVYGSAVVPRLLARSGVRGRTLLCESNRHGTATLTLQVRRGGRWRMGRRYIALWNLASMPAAGQDQPADRSSRAGWAVMQRAIAVAQESGLDLRFRASNPALAAAFYLPLGLAFERPGRPGRKPAMVLRVRRRGQDDAGLGRLRSFVDSAADELGTPRPPVTMDLVSETPNAQATASGRPRARIDASPSLTAAAPALQRWFAAHEVGHLRLGVSRPWRTRLTGPAALAVYLLVAIAAWLMLGLW